MKRLLSAALLLLFVKTSAQNKTTDSLPQVKLDTVTVSAGKSYMQNSLDKLVVNVSANPAVAGQNGLELLRNVPGVVVDAAENISLSGRTGVLVLVDDRPTYLQGTELAQFLKSIGADNIKTIEVMRNPPARYDAGGDAGIINIKLKQSTTRGVSNTLNGSWAQSTHARQSGGASGNWRRAGQNTYWNGGINRGFQQVTAINTRVLDKSTINQSSTESDDFGGANLRLGTDFSRTEKSTIGVLYTFNQRFTTMRNYSTNLLQSTAADTTVYTTVNTPQRFSRHGFNLNYAWAKGGHTVNMDADYITNKATQSNAATNNWQSKGVAAGTSSFANNMQVRINVSTLRADWSHTAGSRKWEGGIKWTNTNNKSSLATRLAAGAAQPSVTAQANDFLFREKIAAAYAGMRHEGKRWQWQGGLRAEASFINGKSGNGTTQVARPDTAYLNLFPTLFVQYNLSQNHQLLFNAARRISRPSYADQNPFYYSLDAFNAEAGNPYLMPQFSYSAEVGYTYKGATGIRLQATQTDGYVEQLTYAVGNSTVMVPQNAGRRRQLSIIASTPLQVAKKLSLYLQAEPYYHHYKIALDGFGTTGRVQGGSWGFNGYASANIAFKKEWAASAGTWYNFQNKSTIYVSKPIGSLNLGLSKKISGKLRAQLAVTDVLNSQRWQQTATAPGLQLNTYRKWESRNLTLSFNWRFGNTKIKEARERTLSNEEELNRIKN